MFGKANGGVIREGFMTEKEMKRFSKGTDTGKKILLSKHLQRMKDTAQDSMNNSFLLIGEREETSKNFVIPNIKEHNSSYIVIDPEGEIYNQVKDDLDGYSIKCMDLSFGINGNRTVCYNPFYYTKTEKDVMNLLDHFVEYKKEFFTSTQLCFLAACIFHFLENDKELSFHTLWKFVNDFVGNEFDNDDKDKLATKYYNEFVNGAAGLTRESIIKDCISLLGQYRHLGTEDQLGLDKMREEYIALFIIPPKMNSKVEDNVISFLLKQLCNRCSEVSHPEGDIPSPDHNIDCIFMDIRYVKKFDFPYTGIMYQNGVDFTVSISATSQMEDIYGDNWRTVAYSLETWIFYSTYAKNTLDLICKEIGGDIGFQFFHPLLTLEELVKLPEQEKCVVLQWRQKPAIDDLLTADIE